MDDPGAPPRALRVVIADDHPVFRRGLRAVLDAERDIEVVAEAADGREAVDLAVVHAPDLVLMDVRMPLIGGIEATRLVRRALRGVKVLMLTFSTDRGDLGRAKRAGADGYLLKTVAAEDVAQAIRTVCAGQPLLAPPSAVLLLGDLDPDAGAEPAPRCPLSDRELQVLGLVAEGLNNRDIARALFISENTVKNHVRNILDKLQLHSRMEAVVYAFREKLVEIG